MSLLEQYISEKGLKTAKILHSEQPTETVSAAVEAFKCKPEDIVKSIIVVTKSVDTNSRKFYLLILQGNRRVKTSKLKKVLNVKDVQLASPDQVFEVSGYRVGDVPPLGVDLPAIVDERVLNHQMVYAGGGKPNNLLFISVDELIACTNPQIADISSLKK